MLLLLMPTGSFCSETHQSARCLIGSEQWESVAICTPAPKSSLWTCRSRRRRIACIRLVLHLTKGSPISSGRKKKWNWTDNIPILSPRPSPRRSQLDIFCLCTMYFYTQYDRAHMGGTWPRSLVLIKWPRRLSQDSNVYVCTDPERWYLI